MATSAPAHGIALILNSALLLTAAGIVVRGCGAIKEIVFANLFGVSRGTDLFVLAFTYATFVPAIVAGAIATVLIAQLPTLRSGALLPPSTLRSSMTGVLVAAGLTAAVTYFLAPFALSTLFHLGGGELDEAVSYARLLTPVCATMVIAAAMGAVLNSAKRFLVAGLAAAATPVVMIGSMLMWGRAWGIQTAAWGMAAGGLAEVAILAAILRMQRGSLFGGYAASPASGLDLKFWQAVALLGLSATIAALSPVIDQIFLARLETGAITVFNYASKVNSILIGLFGTAFSAALYPYLSDLAAQRDMPALQRLSWQIAAFVMPVSVVASAVVFVFSYEIVDLLFARGSFTASDTALVAQVQSVFSFQLVFYAVGLIAMRLLNAMRAARAVLWISCLGLVANAVFDWMFYKNLGASGIALASVLTSVLSLFFAAFFIRIELRQPR